MEKNYLKDYYIKNKETFKKRNNLRYYRIRKQLLKQMKDYVELNKERIKKYKHDYYQKNKNRLRKVHKKYIKIYRTNNSDKINLQKANKRKFDTNYRIRCYLASRIWKALKGISKSKSTLKLLGCSIEKLKQHLEFQFQVGMNWSNYGKWHIDHIRPCAKFDLSKASEQRKCFHYTNLQPLWAKENISKGAK
jgi:hypothetical protein